MSPRRALCLAAAVGLAAATAGCSLLSEDDTTRNAEGQIEEGGDLGVFVMKLGDCFNDAALSGDSGGEVSEVGAVPCDEPHDAQVFHTFDLPDGDFPDETTLTTSADDGCYNAFEGFVGLAYEESAFSIGYLFPTAESWAGGDQEIVCYLTGDGKITVDAKGSAQ